MVRKNPGLQTVVIGVGNQKGGVGKTTMTVQIACALVEQGRKVLIIDLDVNAGATKHFGIKPEGAAVQTHGHDVKAEAFLSVCQQMMEKFPRAKKVITTLRGSISASHNTWAGVLYDGKEMLQTRQYQITDIVDRVGGGDSFMGGLIYGLLTYPGNDQNALDFAVAASCLKHTIKGDANLVTVEEVSKLMGGDASGRVAR